MRRNAPVTCARSLKPKRPGIAWPFERLSWSPANLLRSRRQRHRLVRQRRQISDHVGALRVLLNTGKAHRGAGDKALGVGDELVEGVEGPFAALGLHRGGEVEAALALALFLVDRAIEVRADLVRATLLEGVAGGALLGGGSALLDGG